MKLEKLAQAVSLALIAGTAFAQQPGTPKERIEITGSNIKRIQDEGALPVQVITREEIDKKGIQSLEQLLMQISANGTGADNLQSNVGIQLGTTDRNNLGNSSANLRGLGASSTLVLLNGRRVSNHGAKGNAVDLNSIPLAAIERVEVLKDGASAIYGTDAIGGVINFILRRDYRGVEITGVPWSRSLWRRPRRMPASLVPDMRVEPPRVAQSRAISSSVAEMPYRWSIVTAAAGAQLRRREHLLHRGQERRHPWERRAPVEDHAGGPDDGQTHPRHHRGGSLREPTKAGGTDRQYGANAKFPGA